MTPDMRERRTALESPTPASISLTHFTIPPPVFPLVPTYHSGDNGLQRSAVLAYLSPLKVT